MKGSDRTGIYLGYSDCVGTPPLLGIGRAGDPQSLPPSVTWRSGRGRNSATAVLDLVASVPGEFVPTAWTRDLATVAFLGTTTVDFGFTVTSEDRFARDDIDRWFSGDAHAERAAFDQVLQRRGNAIVEAFLAMTDSPVGRIGPWGPSDPSAFINVDPASQPRIDDLPPELVHSEVLLVPARGATEMHRTEHRIVARYRELLTQLGHKVGQRGYSRDDRTRLRCDLFDYTDNVVIEAKANTSREDIRMAIGQLLDYARCEAEQNGGIAPAMRCLLPSEPSADARGLLESLGIDVVWIDPA